MQKACRAALPALLLAFMTGCSPIPTHEVLPYPDHIKAGISAGDRVQVTTRNGNSRDIVVTGITDDALLTEAGPIPIEDLKRITRRAWSRPGNPCDDDRPLGCSVHPAVKAVSDMHADYARELETPCAEHDYCYRYGHQTYGLAREDCDATFLDAMQALCNTKHKIDFIERSECLSIASQMHAAVSGFGEAYFHKDAYCEYAGPPAHVLWKKPGS